MPNHSIDLTTLNVSVPTMNVHVGGVNHIISITDHPPIIQHTEIGVVATMNLWNPGSPIAPPVATALGVTGGFRLTSVSEKREQMEKMAQFIYDMFKNGVDILAMQEVPPVNSPEFTILQNELKRLDQHTHFIDVDDLAKFWQKTGTHSFGTAILHNPAKCQLASNPGPTPLNNRGQEFIVSDPQTGKKAKVANIHGDFIVQATTQAYCQNFDGIVLGDMNIKNGLLQATQPSTIPSVEIPITTVDGRPVASNTDDAIFDNYSRRVNPSFTPSTSAPPKPIAQPQVIATTPVAPQVFQVPAAKAKQILVDLKAFIITNQRPDLIAANGFIDGVSLKTPQGSPTANITISNPQVQQIFMHFGKQLPQTEPQVDQPQVIAATPVTPQVFQVPAAKAKQILVDLKAFIITNQRPDLIAANGFIDGVSLKTPKGSPTANITISNPQVQQIFMHFGKQLPQSEPQAVITNPSHTSLDSLEQLKAQFCKNRSDIMKQEWFQMFRRSGLSSKELANMDFNDIVNYAKNGSPGYSGNRSLNILVKMNVLDINKNFTHNFKQAHPEFVEANVGLSGAVLI